MAKRDARGTTVADWLAWWHSHDEASRFLLWCVITLHHQDTVIRTLVRQLTRVHEEHAWCAPGHPPKPKPKPTPRTPRKGPK